MQGEGPRACPHHRVRGCEDGKKGSPLACTGHPLGTEKFFQTFKEKDTNEPKTRYSGMKHKGGADFRGEGDTNLWLCVESS